MKVRKFLIKKYVNIHKHKSSILLLIALSVLDIGYAQTWSLKQCVDTAQVYNKTLQMCRNNMEIGIEKQGEAKANLVPKINLNADYKYFADLPYQFMPQSAFGGPEGIYKKVQMGVPHNIGANIQITVPIYNSQIFGAIEATELAAELSELQYRKTEEQVFFEISNLYYSAQILAHQIEFLDSNLINTGKLLENLKLLHEQQMIKKSDVSKVELQKDQLSTQRGLVENNFEQVMGALKFSMGIPVQQEMQIETAIINKELFDYTHSLPFDLQIAFTQNKLLTSELKMLKNSRLPTISLFGSYGQTGFGYAEKPNDFLIFYPSAFAGLQLSIPLFNGTVTKRKINQKNLEIQNNHLQIELVNDQNQMLIENAKRLRLVNWQTIENTQNQIDLANTVYNEMVLQQKEGTATLTDIILADNALRDAQNSNLSAKIDYLKADLELKRLSGNMSLKN